MRHVIVAAAVLLLLPAAKAAQCNTPATATFRDNLTNAPIDRIASDALGLYVDATQNVKAIIDCNGDFDLDTSDSAHQPVYRHVWVDLTQCVSTSCNAPFTAAYQDVYLSTGSGGLMQLAIGATKSMNVQVNLPGGFLRFNPKLYAETSWVTATRTSSTSWTIEAPPNAVAKFVQIGKNGATIDLGDFTVPFQITVNLK